MTRTEFITSYVERCRRIGFAIGQTETGCIYYADGDDIETDYRLIAMPCDCGCEERWGMFEEGGTA
jgi:hypothetical protein